MFMRNWIDIVTEGDIINLGQHKFNKAMDGYVDAIKDVFGSETEFFASGKFVPFAETYIENNFDKRYAPDFQITVYFRDHKMTPEAKDVLNMLRSKRFKVQTTKYHKEFSGAKEGPWADKVISFEELRDIFASKDSGMFGAYRPSRHGFRTTTQDIWDKNGVGFSLFVGGYDSRRGDKPRQEHHVIDNDDDMREVSNMMALIRRAQMR